MLSATRAAAMRHELTADRHVPYTAHVAPEVVKTAFGDYLQVFRLGGISFESADVDHLNVWHEKLNVLWRNVAAPGVALWSHIIRRRETLRPSGSISRGFAATLHEKYGCRLAGEILMLNELYLAVLYRPAAGRTAGLLSRAITRFKPASPRLEAVDALEACRKLAQALCASLARYEPESLGCYQDSGRWYSSLLEYLAMLINGERQRIPLPGGPLAPALTTTRLCFGREVMEYRVTTGTRVGAMLGIKEYPTPSVTGMLDRLLSAPFGFVLTQSFVFLSKASGQALLTRQINRMANAGDFAVSQAEELGEALDALTSNEFVMGDHHFTLQVLAAPDEVPQGRPEEERLRTLNNCVAQARAILADTGMTVAREDLALEAAFWAQLPGSFHLRPRKAPITSRNFAAMVPFHNFPPGRPTGNHWGEALAIFPTRAHSAYHFSLHASDPSDCNSRRDAGHTFICGPTGSGKTVLIGFLVAMLARQSATQVLLDKDRGLERLVRALGGEYLTLRNGLATGFNPLQLPAGPGHLEFLRSWLQLLARPSGARPLNVREQRDLDQALRGVLSLAPETRRLSRLVEFLDPTDPEGLHGRLGRWCETGEGAYAWAFDNTEDSVIGRLHGQSVIGFDVTEFLDNEIVRSPVTMYLFHLVRQLLDGRRLVCWMDEFWRLLEDRAFEGFAKDGPKTWRKLNGVMCLATQSASDVLQSPISRTIIEQTPTKIIFPNADAAPEEYTAGLGLTHRELALIKEELEPGARAFLVKQGHQSVVCRLDLRGFESELEVLSGRAGGH
ncbi:MAG TPA: VirB4 family type IV secretion/conjugal transfer ATPase [Steroidobacteraceae bacterium]|nr:VirB4 family type IV secretion/conjugal transfer ATPase [Steroidobacteraceae bacterium]